MVLLSPAEEAAEVRAAKREICRTFSEVLDRVKPAGAVRADFSIGQLMHLVCGV